MKRFIAAATAGLFVSAAGGGGTFRLFFDIEGSDGELGSHRPGNHVLSYGNPVLPAGGGRLYIYGEFQQDDQTIFSPNYDITVDGGVITDAWHYNEPGQDTLTGDSRWDAASPDPNMATGNFTAANLTHMGLKNGIFADNFDLQHDNTNGFGDTLLGYVDVVNVGGPASVWMTPALGNCGILCWRKGLIFFGFGDDPVEWRSIGQRSEIAEATIVPEPAGLMLLGLGVLALRRRR